MKKLLIVITVILLSGCMSRVDNSTVQAALYYCSDKQGLQFIGAENVYCVDTSIMGRHKVGQLYAEHIRLRGEVHDMAGY